MRVNSESATKSGVKQELKGYAKIINDIKVHPSMLGCFVPRDAEGHLLTLDVNFASMKKIKLGEIINGMLENPLQLETTIPYQQTFHTDPPWIFMARMKVCAKYRN